jgi:hypothetical protein
MTDQSQPAGTGIFARNSSGVFLTIRDQGVEEGYNKSATGIMDTERVPQWNREITVATLGFLTFESRDNIPFLLISTNPHQEKRISFRPMT